MYADIDSCVLTRKSGQGWMAQVDEIKNSKDKDAGKDTIFDGVLKSNLPESEKATVRLGHEAQLTVLAGQDTTGKTGMNELS